MEIRHVRPEDREFWFRLDRHLSEEEFSRKVRDKMGYVLLREGVPAGILRYSLFWDNTPFCNLLYIDPAHQRRGLGRALMAHWEAEMARAGYALVMTSTLSNEEAQHFYRKLGYHDAGGLLLPGEPLELLFTKVLDQ